MAALLVIGALGLALAQLNRGWRRAHAPVDVTALRVPDDVWAAFEAAVDPSADPSQFVMLATRTTVGGLRTGEAGYVSARSARRDRAGSVWVEAAAVVHPTRIDGRIAVRRDADGLHLHCPPALGTLDDIDPRGHVEVARHIA